MDLPMSSVITLRACRSASLEDGASDLVVSFMVLMNVDDLAGVVREAARVLEPGGRFCIAITHPINTAGEFETSEPESAFVIREPYFEAHRKDLQAERGGLTMAFVDLHLHCRTTRAHWKRPDS
jgi:SAM-dependent methyltransferase